MKAIVCDDNLITNLVNTFCTQIRKNKKKVLTK